MGNVYFDTCTLSNFSTVGHLALLEGRYGYRARWTETVREEIRRGSTLKRHLLTVLGASWLGEPVEIDADPAGLDEIEKIRRGLGGSTNDPLQHLGEAEIIYYLELAEPSGIFVTDDRPALDFAKRRGLFVLDSSQILAECYAMGEVPCPTAYEILVDMRTHDRGVHVPPSHLAVCP